MGTREAENRGRKSSKTAENLHGLTLLGHSGLFLHAQPEAAKENDIDIVGQTGQESQTRPGGEKLYSLAPELREKSEHRHREGVELKKTVYKTELRGDKVD